MSVMLVTAEGYARPVADLETLRTDRRASLSDEIRAAREDADSDNPVLFDLVQERIGSLEAHVVAARIVQPAGKGLAGIGSRMCVRHDDTGGGGGVNAASAQPPRPRCEHVARSRRRPSVILCLRAPLWAAAATRKR
jgi:hypothetical protein